MMNNKRNMYAIIKRRYIYRVYKFPLILFLTHVLSLEIKKNLLNIFYAIYRYQNLLACNI